MSRYIPSGKRRQSPCLLILAPAHLLAVRVGAAGNLSFVRVLQHVAPLEVRAVRRLLEDEVFRKMLAVIANMKPGDESVLRTGFSSGESGVSQPKHTELLELRRG